MKLLKRVFFPQMRLSFRQLMEVQHQSCDEIVYTTQKVLPKSSLDTEVELIRR
jgi:hypothetical protein